jgi:ubiquinone/menaquinone biosynthesis C-methylase UbiE
MSELRRTYVPAAGHDWALPLYDPLVKLMGGDAARRALAEQAATQPGDRILEIGCGTGTLTLLLKRLSPEAEVIGLDPDAKALARARRKAERAGVSIQFDQGFSDRLPYPDASFDQVFSSLMFHHLPAEEKEKTVREVRRVLRPGGRFHMLDFAGPEPGRDGWLARLFHANPRLRDNSEGRILDFLRQAGFADPQKTGERALLLWRTVYYRASVAGS